MAARNVWRRIAQHLHGGGAHESKIILMIDMIMALSPTMEPEQKWWKHRKGAHSDYGARAATVEDGGSLLKWDST